MLIGGLKEETPRILGLTVSPHRLLTGGLNEETPGIFGRTSGFCEAEDFLHSEMRLECVTSSLE